MVVAMPLILSSRAAGEKLYPVLVFGISVIVETTRCMSHVIDIANLAALRELTKVNVTIYADNANNFVFSDDLPDATSNSALAADPAYVIALRNDPVARARALVAACRASTTVPGPGTSK